MGALKIVMDFVTGKRNIIKENIGGCGMFLVERVCELKSADAGRFFHHSVICCIADAFEYFLDEGDNIFYRNIDKITEETGERFIKWEAVSHTLFFTHKLADTETVSELEDALFSIFEMTSGEISAYYDFKRLLSENGELFKVSFPVITARDIFGLDEIGAEDTSYIYNYYHTCYTEFYKTYSKYSAMGSAAVKQLAPCGAECGDLRAVGQ